MSSPIIGIDLGTTHSCVGVLQAGKVEIIANDQGNRTTPSCVAFNDKEHLVGEVAKSQALRDPENAVFEVKRLMGRLFYDHEVREDMKSWPFKVLNDRGRPKVQVKYKEKLKRFTAQEINAMVLSKMKTTAETYLGTTVKDAVITVPAYFNDSQRQATKDAATIAGLNARRIINEPTAAALAYGLHKKLAAKRNVLIFDLGGGTFDVSILTIADGSQFKVLTTSGDTHLGGIDFDNRMVDHFVKEFKRKYDEDVSSNQRVMRKLKVDCEQAKKALSACTETAVEIYSFQKNSHFSSKITRARFKMLCMNLFRRTLETLKMALEDSHLTKSEIHDVVLVGGSTRIPKIQQLVKEFFGGNTIKMDINADEVVAYGATLQAAMLSRNFEAVDKDVLLVEVVPLSLGTDIWSGGQRVMKKLIERNAQIPVKRSCSFFTVEDHQTCIHISIYQGERMFVKDNHLLGDVHLSGLRSLPRCQAEVIVEFSIDKDGILKASAKEKETGKSMHVIMTNDRSRLSQPEVAQMIREAEQFRDEDNARHETIAAMEKLERYTYSTSQSIDEAGDVLTESERLKLSQRSMEAIEWIDENALVGKDDLEQQLRKLQMEFESTLAKIRQACYGGKKH